VARHPRADRSLGRRAANGDARARERLIEKYLPLADRLARRYARAREPLDDLIQVARLGLVKAVDRWDPERGTTFSTYAVPTISGELRRYFRDRTWAVRPPRDLQELYLKCVRAREAIVQDLGREPSAEDLARRLDTDLEQIVDALHAGRAYEARSLDRPVDVRRPSGETHRDALVDGRTEIERVEDTVTFRQVSAALDRDDREIVRLRFEEDLVQREIAERLGCSQMHVSRILRAAVRRMAEIATGPGPT
jgi:RNA polymerase sigma-B factor